MGAILLVFTISSVVVLTFVSHRANVANRALTQTIAVRAAFRLAQVRVIDADDNVADTLLNADRTHVAGARDTLRDGAARAGESDRIAGFAGRAAVLDSSSEDEWKSF